MFLKIYQKQYFLFGKILVVEEIVLIFYLLNLITVYRNKDNPFDNPYIENLSTPINWWSSVELKNGEDHIRVLALKLYAIMPHNATRERVFSILNWYLRKRYTK